MPINAEGPFSAGTRRNLVDGLRGSSMTQAAVDAVTSQAVRFVERIVDTYEAQVAPGEVGATGSGRSSGGDILADTPPRTLLYGRIQSGKTVAMIISAALCLDNRFRVVVVITSDNVELVRQTANRFKILDGPRVLSGAREGGAYEWTGQGAALRDTIAETGLVLICAKNAMHLEAMLDFLAEVDASTFPVLILDDEADAATPDTTQAARAAGHLSAPEIPSRIHRLVVTNEDPAELGLSLGEQLSHSVYVPVTATPFVLYLQGDSGRLRPTDTFLLEPGDGYCGGREFFSRFDAKAQIQHTPIVVVNDDHSDFIRHMPPPGFAASIDYFVISACARAMVSSWPTEGFKHLSHTSVRTDDHDRVSRSIRNYVDHQLEILVDANESCNHFVTAYSELRRSVPDAPLLADIIDQLPRHLRQADILRINALSKPTGYGPRLNFLVGGNILGRGLTIDDLIVTYYIREARTSQMDTVWQHARMYGYRQSYFEYMRIYLPLRLAENFQRIHRAEEDLREALAAGEDVERVLIQVPTRTRPTRPNALVEADIRSIRANRRQINPLDYHPDSLAASELLALLEAAQVPTHEPRRDHRPRFVPLEDAIEMARSVVVAAHDQGAWHPEIAVAILRKYEPSMSGRCIVYVRSLSEVAATSDRNRARLSGNEVDLLMRSSSNLPALALLHVGDPSAPDGWYPTLVMPPGTPAYVFGTG